jgi:hypothetical protein
VWSVQWTGLASAGLDWLVQAFCRLFGQGAHLMSWTEGKAAKMGCPELNLVLILGFAFRIAD